MSLFSGSTPLTQKTSVGAPPQATQTQPPQAPPPPVPPLVTVPRVRQNCFLLQHQRLFGVLHIATNANQSQSQGASVGYAVHHYDSSRSETPARASVSNVIFSRKENSGFREVTPNPAQPLSVVTHAFAEHCDLRAFFNETKVYVGGHKKDTTSINAIELGVALSGNEIVQQVKFCPFSESHLAVLTSKRLIVFDIATDVTLPVVQMYVQWADVRQTGIRHQPSTSVTTFIDFEFGVNRSLTCGDFTNTTVFLLNAGGQVACMPFYLDAFDYPPHFKAFMDCNQEQAHAYLFGGVPVDENNTEITAKKYQIIYDGAPSTMNRSSARTSIADPAYDLVRVNDIDFHLLFVLRERRVDVLFSTLAIDAETAAAVGHSEDQRLLVKVANVNFPEQRLEASAVQASSSTLLSRVRYIGEAAPRGHFLFELRDAIFKLDVQWVFDLYDNMYDDARLDAIENRTRLTRVFEAPDPRESRLMALRASYGDFVVLRQQRRGNETQWQTVLEVKDLHVKINRDELIDMIENLKCNEDTIIQREWEKAKQAQAPPARAAQAVAPILVTEAAPKDEAEMLKLMRTYEDRLTNYKKQIDAQYRQFEHRGKEFTEECAMHQQTLLSSVTFYEDLTRRLDEIDRKNKTLEEKMRKHLLHAANNNFTEYNLYNKIMSEELSICQHKIVQLQERANGLKREIRDTPGAVFQAQGTSVAVGAARASSIVGQSSLDQRIKELEQAMNKLTARLGVK